MKKFMLLLFVSLTTTHCFAMPAKGKKIMVILAHPDDETAMAQLLYKWSKQHIVYLVIATDGRYGVRFGNKPGDELAEKREKETECACTILNIQPPIFLKFHEDLGMFKGIGEYHKQSEALALKIKEQILLINPDVIFTFGPDGDTGHFMHRQISNSVTEVILKEGWAEKYSLFYVAWTEKDSEKMKASQGLTLNTVNTKYFNLNESFSQQEEDVALQILECYKTQLSADEMNAWKLAEINDRSNNLNFRKMMVSRKRNYKL
jgi:N-acetylglucosamine malate deacetylase 2